MDILSFKHRVIDKLIPILVVTAISLLPTAMLIGGCYLMLRPQKTITEEKVPIKDTLRQYSLPMDKNYVKTPLNG